MLTGSLSVSRKLSPSKEFSSSLRSDTDKDKTIDSKYPAGLHITSKSSPTTPISTHPESTPVSTLSSREHATWLDKANIPLMDAINNIEGALRNLKRICELKQNEYFNNEKLLENLGQNKKEALQALRQKLENEKDKLKAKMEHNRLLWDQQTRQFQEIVAGLRESRKQELISGLLDWQDKINESYDAEFLEYSRKTQLNLTKEENRKSKSFTDAKTEFDELLLKLEKEIDRGQKQKLMLQFNIKYAGVAKIQEKMVRYEYYPILTDITKEAIVPLVHPVINIQLFDSPRENKRFTRDELQAKLKEKTLEDLIKLADKTGLGTLKNTGLYLLKDIEREERKARPLHEKLPENIKLLTDKDVQQSVLLAQAEKEISDYDLEGSRLQVSNKALYENLQKRKDDLYAKIDVAQFHLDEAYNAITDISAEEDAKKEMDYDCIIRFERLSRVHDDVSRKIAEWRLEAISIVSDYIKADQQSGLDHSVLMHNFAHAIDVKTKDLTVGTKDHSAKARLKMSIGPSLDNDPKILSLIADKKGHTSVSTVRSYIENNINIIGEAKYDLALTEMLGLIRIAIEENVNFWHEQIDSFWGSSSKIGDVTVPNGISRMYEILNKPLMSVQDKLRDIIGVASDKKSTHLGWFAKRSENTTDRFYQIIKDLTLKGGRPVYYKIDNVQTNTQIIINGKPMLTVNRETNVKKVKGELANIIDKKKNKLNLEPQMVNEDAVLRRSAALAR